MKCYLLFKLIWYSGWFCVIQYRKVSHFNDLKVSYVHIFYILVYKYDKRGKNVFFLNFYPQIVELSFFSKLLLLYWLLKDWSKVLNICILSRVPGNHEFNIPVLLSHLLNKTFRRGGEGVNPGVKMLINRHTKPHSIIGLSFSGWMTFLCQGGVIQFYFMFFFKWENTFIALIFSLVILKYFHCFLLLLHILIFAPFQLIACTKKNLLRHKQKERKKLWRSAEIKDAVT